MVVVAGAALPRITSAERKALNLLENTGKLKRKDRVALAFARKMSLTAAAVTDDEFAELLALFGPEKTVGIDGKSQHVDQAPSLSGSVPAY